jgi:hypothetical protein
MRIKATYCGKGCCLLKGDRKILKLTQENNYTSVKFKNGKVDIVLKKKYENIIEFLKEWDNIKVFN